MPVLVGQFDPAQPRTAAGKASLVEEPLLRLPATFPVAGAVELDAVEEANGQDLRPGGRVFDPDGTLAGATQVLPFGPRIQAVMEPTLAAGARAFVGVLAGHPGDSCCQYVPYDGVFREIPGVWVRGSDGARLREFVETRHGLAPSGRPEPRWWFTSRIPRLEAAVASALAAEGITRSLILPPDALGPHPTTDGGLFHLHGIPPVHFLAAPFCLFDERDRMDEIDEASRVPRAARPSGSSRPPVTFLRRRCGGERRGPPPRSPGRPLRIGRPPETGAPRRRAPVPCAATRRPGSGTRTTRGASDRTGRRRARRYSSGRGPGYPSGPRARRILREVPLNERPPRPSARIPRPRRGIAIALAALVAFGAGARIALPELLRRTLEAKSGSLLRGELRIDDVDLSLTGSRIRAEGVELHPTGATGSRPLRAGRIEVAVSWWELPFGRLHLRELAVDDAAVEIHRDPSGRIDLLDLFGRSVSPDRPELPPRDRRPASAEAPAAGEVDSAAEDGFAWRVDHLRLRGGRLRVSDASRPGAAPLEIDIDPLELGDVAGEPGRPVSADVRAALRVAGVPVGIEGELRDLLGDPSADLQVQIVGLPLRRVHPYLGFPELEALEGTLSAEFSYRLEAGRKHRVAGSLRARDLSVRAAATPTPALAAREVLLEETRLAWPEARLRIGSLRVQEPRLPFDPRAPEALPLAAAFRSPGTGSDPEDSEEEPAFAWSVDRAEVLEGELLLAAPEGENLSFGLEARGLGSGAKEAGLGAELAGAGGSASFAGRIRPDPFGLSGRLALAGIRLDRLGAIVGGEAARWLRGGEFGGEFELSVGSLGSRPGRPELSGEAEAGDLLIGDGGGPLGGRVGLARATGLAIHPAGEGLPRRIEVARLEIEDPELRYERRAPGPGPISRAETSASPAEGDVPGTEERATVRVSIGELRLRRGSVGFRDLTTTPFFRASIGDLAGSVRELDLAAGSARQVELSGSGPSGASFRARGSLGRPGERLEVEVENFDLRSLNPYSMARDVEIRKGTLDLRSRIETAGTSIRTRNRISVRNLDLGGGGADAMASSLVGLRLSLAIALLEDAKGRIRLTVPFEFRSGALRIGLGPVLRDAFRSALVGALASPLKLVGALVPSRKGSIARPEPVFFVPGSAELLPDGRTRLRKLAELLAGHPRLAAEARVLSTAADLVARRDEILAGRLANPDLALRFATLGEGDAARSLRRWLEQPPTGRDPAVLTEAAAELRSRLHREIEVEASWLDALGAQRIEALEAELLTGAGLEGRVVAIGEARPASEDPPRAELILRPRTP